MKFLDLFHFFFENESTGKSKPVQKVQQEPVNQQNIEVDEIDSDSFIDETEMECFFDDM